MPARTALARAARWFVDNGFVDDKHVARIRDAGKLTAGIDLREEVSDPARKTEAADQ
jgi:hypothetical protein